MNKTRIVIMLIASTIFMSNIALAEGGKLKDKLSKGTVVLTANLKGCDADAKKLCPGLDSNSQKAFMCMMAYEDKLSEACKLGIMEAAMSIKMGAAAIDYSVQSCEADADKYCLDVKPGDGRLVGCIKKNESKVSKACVTALKETGLWKMGSK